MARNFSQLFDVIYDKFISLQEAQDEKASVRGFGMFLGHGHDGRVKAWKAGQWPAAEDCLKIEQKLGFRLRWLVAGEGDPFEDSPPTIPSPDAEKTCCEDALSAFKAELNQEQAHVRELLWENRQLRMELDRLRQVANRENFVEPTAPASLGAAHCLPSGSERLAAGSRLQEPQGDGLPVTRQSV